MAQITDIVNQLDDVTASFNDVVDSAQKRMLNHVITLMKDLSIKDGRISPSVENLKIVNAIRGKLSKLVLDKKYMSGLKKLLKSFSDVQGEQIDYFKAQFGSKNLSGKYGLTLQMSIDNTAQALSGSGINANVVDRLKSMLVRSVVSGGQFSDLVGQVREYLTDTPTSAGALSRYAKTYATTALSQFTGETNKLLTDDYKPEWYRYVGSNKETTREWCEHMTEKEWVHISEFEQIIDGKIDGKEVEIYKKTGLPRGMIEGTNTENLLVNRGGWGCQHQFYAVDERIVPDSVKNQLKKEEIPAVLEKLNLSGDKAFLDSSKSLEIEMLEKELRFLKSDLAGAQKDVGVSKTEAIIKNKNINTKTIKLENIPRRYEEDGKIYEITVNEQEMASMYQRAFERSDKVLYKYKQVGSEKEIITTNTSKINRLKEQIDAKEARITEIKSGVGDERILRDMEFKNIARREQQIMASISVDKAIKNTFDLLKKEIKGDAFGAQSTNTKYIDSEKYGKIRISDHESRSEQIGTRQASQSKAVTYAQENINIKITKNNRVLVEIGGKEYNIALYNVNTEMDIAKFVLEQIKRLPLN